MKNRAALFLFLLTAAAAVWWWRMTSKNEARLVLAQTIYGEARGEGYDGMAAVASVVMNRVKTDLGNDGLPDWWGEGVIEVCKKKWQFSAWNPGDPNAELIQRMRPGANAVFDQAYDIAGRAIAGTLPDPTGGATHYYNPAYVDPDWDDAMTMTAAIGQHRFFV